MKKITKAQMGQYFSAHYTPTFNIDVFSHI